jgi:hypothetical protein
MAPVACHESFSTSAVRPISCGKEVLSLKVQTPARLIDFDWMPENAFQRRPDSKGQVELTTAGEGTMGLRFLEFFTSDEAFHDQIIWS